MHGKFLHGNPAGQEKWDDVAQVLNSQPKLLQAYLLKLDKW